jgi:hypothetical protein
VVHRKDKTMTRNSILFAASTAALHFVARKKKFGDRSMRDPRQSDESLVGLHNSLRRTRIKQGIYKSTSKYSYAVTNGVNAVYLNCES